MPKIFIFDVSESRDMDYETRGRSKKLYIGESASATAIPFNTFWRRLALNTNFPFIHPFNNSNCCSSNFPNGTGVGMLAWIWLITENFRVIKTHEGPGTVSDGRLHYWEWTFMGVICWQLNFTTPFNCKWRGTIPILDVEELKKDFSITCRIRNQHFLLLVQLFLSLKTGPQRFLQLATTNNSLLSFPADYFLRRFLMI